MASETGANKPAKKLTIQEWKNRMREGLTKAKVKVGEYAQKLETAQSTTEAAHKELNKATRSLSEMTEVLTVQTAAIDAQTSVGHRAGVDGTGIVAAVALDVAAFEGLSAAAAKWPAVLRHRKWLSGAPQILLGLGAYGMSLKKRAENPGHFGSVPGQIAEEAGKHLIVVGASNIAKAYLAP